MAMVSEAEAATTDINRNTKWYAIKNTRGVVLAVYNAHSADDALTRYVESAKAQEYIESTNDDAITTQGITAEVL